MSFKLTLEIDESGNTQVDFDGNINHMVIVGALENIKHSILRTIEIQSLQSQMAAAQEALQEQQEQQEQSEEAPTS